MRRSPPDPSLLSRATLDGVLLRLPCRRRALEAELARLGPLRLAPGREGTRDVCAAHLEIWRVRGGAVQLGAHDQHTWSERFGAALASVLGAGALAPGAIERCESAFGAMSRAATGALATYSELMLAVPGVVARGHRGHEGRPHALVLGMVTDSALARWADAALGFGYQKQAGVFRDDSRGEWSVALRGVGPLLSVTMGDAPIGRESFPDIDEVFGQPLLGVTGRRRLVASHLGRALSQTAARAHGVSARLRIQGASLEGLFAPAHDLPAYSARSPWGAIRFANVEARVSYPYPAGTD